MDNNAPNPMFRRATKHAARLRAAMIGPAGTGKTYSALAIAKAIGGRVAVIDSERGSASKYAREFEFDVLELDKFGPQDYVRAIQAAEREGYDVLVIDSLSHAWMGKGGALEMVDAVARRTKANNSFGAWREVTPLHNQMVDAIVGSRCHVIATMRAKTEWVQEKDERGKTVIRKVGMAPVQRDGLEYEFDLVGDLDQEHYLTVTKSRCPELDGQVIAKPGEQVAKALVAWLDGDAPPAEKAKPAVQQQAVGEAAPASAAPAAITLGQILARIKAAPNEASMVAIAQDCERLGPNEKKVARSAYGARLKVLRARDKLAAMMFGANAHQGAVDTLAAAGILAATPDDISGLQDQEVHDAIEFLEESAAHQGEPDDDFHGV